MFVCVSVLYGCVCVRERDRERDRQTYRQREREKEREFSISSIFAAAMKYESYFSFDKEQFQAEETLRNFFDL